MKATASLSLGMTLACALTALVAQPANRPTTDGLVITNLASTPVHATAVTLPAARLTAALGLPAGTPLRAKTTAGREEIGRAHV